MKTIITIAAAAALFGAAGTAVAQQSVTVGGTAPAICMLPASYSFVSGNAGATGSGFSGQVWSIPQSAFAGTDATPVPGDGYAIRVRGTGFCNTSHTIEVTSARGGLSEGAQGAAAPAGFANRRNMTYRAHWTNGSSSTPVGPVAEIVNVSTPGAQSTADYTVSGTLPPPGSRPFDVVMSVQRPPLATPLVAGFYWDTVTVTLAPSS
jgi:hypothetical protein